MSILSDFFISDKEDDPQYAGGVDFCDADKLVWKGLSPLQAAQILAIVRGIKYSPDLMSEFTLVSPEDADEWTMSVPSDMVIFFAELDETQIPKLAETISKTTYEELRAEADDFESFIKSFKILSQRCTAANKRLYLWNSL